MFHCPPLSADCQPPNHVIIKKQFQSINFCHCVGSYHFYFYHTVSFIELIFLKTALMHFCFGIIVLTIWKLLSDF